jgi:hypothetical protein
LSLAAHRNAYRISRSNNNRKKKESYDYNFDYDTGSQSGHDIGHEISGHEDTYGTEHIGKSGYSEGSGKCSLDNNCRWDGIEIILDVVNLFVNFFMVLKLSCTEVQHLIFSQILMVKLTQ